MLKVAVLGATGRMGKSLIRGIAESSDLTVAAAVTVPSDPALGKDAGVEAGIDALDIALSDESHRVLHDAQVAIDFTLPDALEGNIKACIATGTPLVVGTTGLEVRHQDLLDEAASEIPLVYARNMSVGVNVFMSLVAAAAKTLDADYDVEIIEAHHRHKVDAPSGTALAVGEMIANAKGSKLEDLAVRSRDGQTGPRVPGTIGFSVVRGGDIVGEHTAMFVAPEERLEFTHRAGDRKTFTRGALRAARWIAGRAPGRYAMTDVLGL